MTGSYEKEDDPRIVGPVEERGRGRTKRRRKASLGYIPAQTAAIYTA